MSVKIDILDYQYGLGDNMVDVNEASSGLGSGWTAVSPTNAAWDGSGTGVTYLNNISSQVLITGRTYYLSFKVYGFSGIGDMGFSLNTGVPYEARFSSATTGSSSGWSSVTSTGGVWNGTYVATGVGFPDLFGRNTNSGNISSISIKDSSIIDLDNSMIGELDITDHSDFPLALTFQISDFKDLTSTTGDYSKTFKIPATKNNNKIFKNIFSPISDNYNSITNQKPCRIQFNNLYSLVGLIQLDGVGGYGQTPSYYNCVFFGSNLSWASKLQDKPMNLIDWGSNGEGITYNKNSIVATWQHTDSDNTSKSPIVYPITSYGEYNEEGVQDSIQLLDTKFGTGQTSCSDCLGYFGFHSSGIEYGTPNPVADWRPAVFIKQTIDKIFSQVGGSQVDGIGYVVNSVFMETDIFKKLVWLLPNFKYNNHDSRTIKFDYGNTFKNEGLIKSILVAPTNSVVYPPPFQITEFTFNLNNSSDFVLNTDTDNTGWDPSTGIFTAQEYGNYTTQLNNFGFYWEKTVYNGGSLDVEYVKIVLQVKTVGETSFNTVDFSQSSSLYLSGSGSQSGSLVFPSTTSSRFLNKNDQIRLKVFIKARTVAYSGNQLTISIFGSSNPVSPTISNIANATYNIALDPFNVEYGQTYDLKDVINADYSQVDFIKGVAHAFNLQMITDENTRTISIEPFDTFYKPYSDAIDWTYKLDRISEVSDNWLENDLKRTLVFKYKSDGADAKVKHRGEEFFHNIEDEYPYREILPKTFKKGDSTFENPFFAGTYNAQDQESVGSPFIDTAYSACLWTENTSSNDTGRPDKGYEFLPRLLYWKKYSPASGSGSKIAKVQTWNSITNFITANASANPTYTLSTIYPQATMLNRDDFGSPNLAYGNAWVRNYNDATGVYTDYVSQRGLYDTYYRFMFEMLKLRPRLRTVYIDLSITDVINLDFRKLVYIDGVYWRINKISDYMPNKIKSTKVELVEWLQLGIFAATLPPPRVPRVNESLYTNKYNLTL